MATRSVGDLPLIVIAGPTASGKTSLAIRLAVEFDGEIICADSRTVYRGMDVGTAKPTKEERALVPHWGLDLVDPGDGFSAADFKEYALNKIRDIRERGKVPFLVGGTGLYVDGVVFDFEFGPKAEGSFRAEIEGMTVKELQEYCVDNNIKLPVNKLNPRHLVRAIELKNISVKRRRQLIENCIVVGIATDKRELRTRIEKRSEHIFSNNVVEEAMKLGKKYGWGSEAMTGNIYPLVRKYIDGDIDEVTLRQDFATSDWRLAKRQLTWLRRNEHLLWADLESAEQYLMDILAGRSDV